MSNAGRVAFMPAATDGCGFYRMFMPHIHTPGSTYHVCPPKGGIPSNYLTGAKVAVVQRQMLPINLESIMTLKRMGIRVVCDLDDNFWALPKWNPAYEAFHRPDIRAGLEACLEQCDVITTSTSYLRQMVERHTHIRKPIIAIDNAIDFNMFCRQRPFNQNGKVIIGWAGSSTHSGDLEEMALPALFNVATSRDDVLVGFMGTETEKVRAFRFHHPDKIKLYPTTQIYAYPAWYSNLDWDITIAPLADNEFNRSKSPIKMIEASALRVPCLASDLENYREFCRLDEKLGWLLCSTQAEWERKLHALVDDEPLRHDLAARMLTRTQQRYRMDKKIREWFDVFMGASC